jgi:hypothetical protein
MILPENNQLLDKLNNYFNDSDSLEDADRRYTLFNATLGNDEAMVAFYIQSGWTYDDFIGLCIRMMARARNTADRFDT